MPIKIHLVSCLIAFLVGTAMSAAGDPDLTSIPNCLLQSKWSEANSWRKARKETLLRLEKEMGTPASYWDGNARTKAADKARDAFRDAVRVQQDLNWVRGTLELINDIDKLTQSEKDMLDWAKSQKAASRIDEIRLVRGMAKKFNVSSATSTFDNDKLATAAATNNLLGAEAAIQSGANPDSGGALTLAARSGNLEMAAFLVRCGATGFGSAINEAIQSINEPMVELLAKGSGGSLSDYQAALNNAKSSAMSAGVASLADKGKAGALRYVLSRGEDPNQRVNGIPAIYHAITNIRNAKTETPNDVEVLSALIEGGADLNARFNPYPLAVKNDITPKAWLTEGFYTPSYSLAPPKASRCAMLFSDEDLLAKNAEAQEDARIAQELGVSRLEVTQKKASLAVIRAPQTLDAYLEAFAYGRQPQDLREATKLARTAEDKGKIESKMMLLVRDKSKLLDIQVGDAKFSEKANDKRDTANFLFLNSDTITARQRLKISAKVRKSPNALVDFKAPYRVRLNFIIRIHKQNVTKLAAPGGGGLLGALGGFLSDVSAQVRNSVTTLEKSVWITVDPDPSKSESLSLDYGEIAIGGVTKASAVLSFEGTEKVTSAEVEVRVVAMDRQ